MPKIYSHFENSPPRRPESGGGVVLVETAGYVPKEIQLQMLLDSGAALESYNKRMFPSMVPASEYGKEEYDPTVQVGYDYFDYREDVTFVKNNMERKLAEIEREKVDKAAAAKLAAVNPSVSASDSKSVNGTVEVPQGGLSPSDKVGA